MPNKIAEGLIVFIAVLVVVLLTLIPFACVQGIQEQKRVQEEMQADNCKLALQEKTGKVIYCGKACWRDEVRKEFTCKSGTKVIIE